MTIYLFLDGLIRDTMHATPSTKTIHDAWNNAHFLEDKEYDSDVGMVEGKKRTLTKWYQKCSWSEVLTRLVGVAGDTQGSCR